jgi:Na+-transporting NADH:ubiquinone oxidoreductase subunit F
VLPISFVRTATPTTRIVRLDLGGAPFAFEAGQAALIGVAERQERVPYSIASAPSETAQTGLLDFLIKVEPSGRWGHQFDRLEPGMRIGVEGPYGSFLFPAAPVERSFLFIAGGTGIAPIRAMIRQALLTGVSGRMRLLYSARTADDFAYLPELGEMASRDGLDLRLQVTREAPEAWNAARGRISLAQLAPLVDDPATLCFVCGPESLMADVPPMLQELGIDRERIRAEEW